MGRVSGKVALVTGGASGLGAASSILLAKEGAKIFLTDLKDDHAAEVMDKIRAAGGECHFARQDVTVEAEWVTTIDAVIAKFGALNIVVNCAGVGVAANIEEATYEHFKFINKVNYDGVFLGTKYGIAGIRQSGGTGSVINLSSIEGLVGNADLIAYNGSKGGVRLLTKAAALHCARQRYGIRVNSVHPGHIKTPMVMRSLEVQPDPAAAMAALTAEYPGGEIGEPDDIAYGVLYLASDESKFVTGSELVIDGGFTAR
jgi:NAD(P)-dependent dehydrogenase (short-subunit alcohol dehydrogenase family)